VTEVLDIDPLVDERWDRFVRSHASSDVFHSTPWLRVLALTYGFDLHASMVVEDGETVGGAVYADVDGFGPVRRKSLAFSDFCDPLVRQSSFWPRLEDALLAGGHPFSMRCREFRPPTQDVRIQASGEVAWHRCDVSRSIDEIWQSLHPSARRAVRKAEKAGVDVQSAESLSDVRDFYLLHLEVRARKYGLLAQPFSFFESIWREFLERGAGELLLARVDDRVVGGTMYLDWGETAYYKFNASDVELLNVRPNDLLLWSGIERAKKRGLSWVDFGVSDLDQPGLIRFKEKYATESGEVITYLAGPEPAPGGEESRIRDVITQMAGLACGDEVPREVTERAGEILYRYFA
jgi:hypothetical protein